MSIKSQLQQQLWQAIGNVGTLPKAAQLTPKTLPLQRFSSPNYVSYRSAIALQLSSAWQQTPLDIAHQLTVALLTLSQASVDSIGIDFTVEVSPPGWILFRLSDLSLASWLQQWFQIPLGFWVPRDALKQKIQNQGGVKDGEKVGKNHPNSDQIFRLQYVHARCCSLLRLADEQGLIQVTDAGERGDEGACRDAPWRVWGAGEDLFSITAYPSSIPNSQSPMVIISPNPIPWLKDAEESNRESVRLRFTHPAERDLIVQLLDLLDVMSASDCQRWVKQGLAVSQAYEKFDKSCRIWGEVKTDDLSLAQARLGLIGVTQVVLRSLLQEQLGVSAPKAL